MIQDYLEEVIRETIDMKGFTSLKAYNLYEQSEKLKNNIKYIKEANNKLSDAIIVEEEYKKYTKNKNKQ